MSRRCAQVAISVPPVPPFFKFGLQAIYGPKIECQTESKGGESKVYGTMRENRTRLAVARKDDGNKDDGGPPNSWLSDDGR
jgi:hypothetical protein